MNMTNTEYQPNTHSRINRLIVGENLWNGAIVNQSLADAYNAIQDDINRFIDARMTVPEYLLNGSFKLINEAI